MTTKYVHLTDDEIDTQVTEFLDETGVSVSPLNLDIFVGLLYALHLAKYLKEIGEDQASEDVAYVGTILSDVGDRIFNAGSLLTQRLYVSEEDTTETEEPAEGC